MKEHVTQQTGKRGNDVREIPTWARRYAANRTLFLAVYLLVYLGSTAAVVGIQAGLSDLRSWAFVAERRVLAVALEIASWSCLALWVGFIFYMGRMARRVEERLYRGEGMVSLSTPLPITRRGRIAAVLMGALWGIGFALLFSLSARGFLTFRSIQPITAAFFVPIFVFSWVLGRVRRRDGVSPLPVLWPLLWPALYGIHAILLAAGAPIYFEKWGAWNILIPMVGYGTIAALAGHIYSRVALRRLRGLAACTEIPGEVEEGER